MKKLLLIILLLGIGSICQGQIKPIYNVKLIDKPINIPTEFHRLEAKIDSLEKRLAWHEKMHIDDSLRAKRSLYVTDDWRETTEWNEDQAIGKDVENNFFQILDNVYMPHNDTISWFEFYDCLIPPKNKSVTVWHKNNADIFYKVDSITFKR